MNACTQRVITMQMHATRIALLLAGKNAALLIGGALRILDNGEKEKRRCGLKLEWISGSECTQSLMHVFEFKLSSYKLLRVI